MSKSRCPRTRQSSPSRRLLRHGYPRADASKDYDEKLIDMSLKEPRGVCFVGLMSDRYGIRALPAPAKLVSKIQSVRHETAACHPFSCDQTGTA
jgi:hypothetical protein